MKNKTDLLCQDRSIELEIQHNQAESHYNRAELFLYECKALVSISLSNVHSRRSSDILEKADNGIEFINAALITSPHNPKYLNTKALLHSEGLGDSKFGLCILDEAAQISPDDIQIRQNIRALKKRIKGQEAELRFAGIILQLFFLIIAGVVVFLLITTSALSDFFTTVRGDYYRILLFIDDINQYLYPYYKGM